VDKQGKTVDFLLRPDRGIAAAQAFFLSHDKSDAMAAQGDLGWSRSESLRATPLAAGEPEVEIRRGAQLQIFEQYRWCARESLALPAGENPAPARG